MIKVVELTLNCAGLFIFQINFVHSWWNSLRMNYICLKYSCLCAHAVYVVLEADSLTVLFMNISKSGNNAIAAIK